MEIQILSDLLITLALAIVVLFICHQVRVPVIVGFILTGILAGPHVFGLIKAVHQVEVLAEIGVVLLLFTIGVEFSFADLLQIRKSVLVAGPIQVALTCLAGFALALQVGKPFGESVFIGFLLSLSSTAIVLKLLQGSAEVDSPHGRTGLGILIFQDIIIVPMMLMVPLLTGVTDNVGSSLLILLGKALLIILLVIAAAKWMVPQLLFQIAKTRSRELFLLAIVAVCFAVAWLTASAGLSLALGAFLAGLIISETEYSHQALSNILPFRDIFASFFFISIGMLLDVNFLFQQPWLIALITLGVLVLKSLIGGIAALLIGFPLRTAILIGLAISQVGEFSFILSEAGISQGIFSGNTYQLFLNATIMTMIATPLLMALAPRAADAVLRLPMPRRLRTGSFLVQEVKKAGQKDHLIIVGFGVSGRNLARAARKSSIPYVIVEMNPETVKTTRTKGEPIFYGDATQEEILKHARIQEARIVVVAINDPAATRMITHLARTLNPGVYLIVRTRYLQEVQPLYDAGANDVVPEEFETSVEIFNLVLKKYLIPRQEIERLTAEVRARCYQVFRSEKELEPFDGLKPGLPDIEISTFRLADRAPLAGKSLAQMELRKRYGLTVLAIRRDGQMLPNPEPDMQLKDQDLLIVMGPPDTLASQSWLFESRELGEKEV
ncbi:MAG: cation:proton antiporter [Syntrophobacterales bacterium]|jgi:CPA2 family monovalent cation:H+ antiporter-2|nr:cation:proton antiporter [Syntrophobacterales bacterium]